MTTTKPPWYTSQELTPSGDCRGGSEHEWVPEGNATYLRCYKGNESADMHAVDDDGECLNCGVTHWRPEAVEAHHQADEMNEKLQTALHQLAEESVLPAPVAIVMCAMPEEAGR